MGVAVVGVRMSYNTHEIAMDIEELDVVKRVDTGKERLTVVFDLNRSGHGQFNEELKPAHYEAVLAETRDTVFQEEHPQGSAKVEKHPNKEEIHLNFVV